MTTATTEKLSVEEFCEKYEHIIEQRAKNWAAGINAAALHYDQLVSEGYLRLVELAYDERVQEKENPRAYITRAINRAFGRYLRANSDPFRLPRHVKMEEFEPIPTCPVEEDARIDTESVDEIDLQDDLLHGCCTSDVERNIMRLRLARYTDDEISEALNIDRRQVDRARARIGERYESRHDQEII